ncbi:uncharacterized protein [Centruroides vittatus]|uniref:uncharacterized protein LOC111631681 n=1 Tax=Centruroides sculpturatus TaxID=218467 RepID=UPI000C6DF6C6|nr:uncharacterized protein LOC111631681 [Centruroides sculpturatus]
MGGVHLCLLLFLCTDLLAAQLSPRSRTFVSSAEQRPLLPATQAAANDVPRGSFFRQPWAKRDPRYSDPDKVDPAAGRSLRVRRANRQYDVPQIECPSAEDGTERFACPSADRMGRYRCIDDHVLCDGFIDCPNAEDEDRMSCMFYKTTKAHLDVLADALLRWARGRY